MSKEPAVLLSCPLKIEFPGGRQEAEALLTDSTLELKLRHGDTKTYSYRDIIKIHAADYSLYIQVSDEKLELSSGGEA